MKFACVLLLSLVCVVSARQLTEEHVTLDPEVLRSNAFLEVTAKLDAEKVYAVHYDGNDAFSIVNKNANGICGAVWAGAGNLPLPEKKKHFGVCIFITADNKDVPVHYSVVSTERNLPETVYYAVKTGDPGARKGDWPVAGGAVDNVWAPGPILDAATFAAVVPARSTSARGHMAASAYFTDAKSEASFNFWNVFPSFNNAPNNFDGNVWANREGACVRYINAGNNLYIVVGTSGNQGVNAFSAAVAPYTRATTLDVPAEAWTAIYDKKNSRMLGWKCAVAFDTSKATNPKHICKYMTVNEIQTAYNTDPFPSVDKTTACRDNKDATVFAGANFPAADATQNRGGVDYWA